MSEIFIHCVTCLIIINTTGFYLISQKTLWTIIFILLCSLGADSLRQWWLASAGGGISPFFVCEVMGWSLLGRLSTVLNVSYM